jgi:hypothetical protein
MRLAGRGSYTRGIAEFGRIAALLILAFAFFGPAARAAALTVSCVGPAPVEVGVSFSITCSVTAGGTGPYNWNFTGGSTVPSGTSVSGTPAQTWTISGAPTGVGAYSFTVTATDTIFPSGSGNATTISGTVIAAPTVNCTVNTAVPEVGVAYSANCSGSGGSGGYSYSQTGLPTNLTINSSTGAITGSPTVAGVHNYSVTVTDSNGGQGSQNVNLSITPAPTFTCTNNNVPIKILWFYTTTCTMTAGTGTLPFTWTISAGGLPAGITGPNPGSGVATTISGPPTGVPPGGEAASYTLEVTDSLGASHQQLFIGNIAGPTLRSWVSSNGDDANLCTRNSPCRTFAIAYQITLPSGEIDVQGAGEFGPLVIAQALTIDGGVEAASIGSALGGTPCPTASAICIAAGVADTVTVRNLSITVGVGQAGILFDTGEYVRVEHVNITGGSSMLYGVEVLSGNASLDDVHIQNANDAGGVGVEVSAGAKLSVGNSSMTHNATGLLATGSGSVAQLQNCVLAFNTTAAVSSASSATLRLSNSTIMNNFLGLQTAGGGSLISFGNNRIFSNTTNGNPTVATTLK